MTQPAAGAAGNADLLPALAQGCFPPPHSLAPLLAALCWAGCSGGSGMPLAPS